jgi:Protein of unknown function (DUF3293)
MNPKDHRQSYLETIYHAGDEAFTLSARETGKVLFEGQRFSFITAQNPLSQPLPDSENFERNEKMRLEIEARGWAYGDSSGSSPDQDWRENGFVIWDAPLEDVLELGRRFGQNAIVHGEAGRVALGWCAMNELEWFYAAPRSWPSTFDGRAL